MRVIVQRVSRASVKVEDELISEIGKGFLLLLAISKEDTENDVDYLVSKIKSLRVFDDEEGKMNRNIFDVSGEMLLVSQFTLYGDCRKGNRPSYDKAAKPNKAKELYEIFYKKLRESELNVKHGKFGAHMNVELCNSGPVTILVDSSKIF